MMMAVPVKMSVKNINLCYVNIFTIILSKAPWTFHVYGTHTLLSSSSSISQLKFILQDNMATMHDVLDAQWMYDNFKDGEILVT